jgi:hypothetical protein
MQNWHFYSGAGMLKEWESTLREKTFMMPRSEISSKTLFLQTQLRPSTRRRSALLVMGERWLDKPRLKSNHNAAFSVF